MRTPRSIEIHTWIWGSRYAVSTKINGKLMETVTCGPGQVFDVRAKAAAVWTQEHDTMYISPVPDMDHAAQLYAHQSTALPVSVVNIINLKRGIEKEEL